MKKIRIEKRVALGLLILLFWLIFLFWPSEKFSTDYVYQQNQTSKEIKIQETEKINDSFPNVQEMHFTKRKITYILNIDGSVNSTSLEFLKQMFYIDFSKNDKYKMKRIRWALDVIENASQNQIEFIEVENSEDPMLTIVGFPDFYCSNETDMEHEIGGLGGIENLYEDNQINNSIVVFCSHQRYFDIPLYDWYDEYCEDFPVTEIHEILHAFGFGHNFNNSHSIMYPIKHASQVCANREIDEQTSNCLSKVYSNNKINGDCSNLNIYPYEIREVNTEIDNFKWANYPVGYLAINCTSAQNNSLAFAARLINEEVGTDMIESARHPNWKVEIICGETYRDVLLTQETDYWPESNYFPAAIPEYLLENGEIKKVKIHLLGESFCRGIELHELLHSLGLVKHYGAWMTEEVNYCSGTYLNDIESINEVKKLYNLQDNF